MWHMEDCEQLQADINAVYQWCIDNKLLFNPSKCCTMSFTRALQPLHANYHLSNDSINRVNSVKDLGVLFDAKLTFNDHISTLAAECYKRLGFVIRNARDFHDHRAIELLYSALVRSKIETASVVWGPHEKGYNLILEKVQKAFLRFLYKKRFGYYPFLYPTQFLMGVLGFNSLETRRNCQLLLTFCQVLRGESNCPDLLSKAFRLFVPDKYLRGRAHHLLALPATRTVAYRQSPLPRALGLLRDVLASAPHTDLFADGWSRLRNAFIIYCENIN